MPVSPEALLTMHALTAGAILGQAGRLGVLVEQCCASALPLPAQAPLEN